MGKEYNINISRVNMVNSFRNQNMVICNRHINTLTQGVIRNDIIILWDPLYVLMKLGFAKGLNTIFEPEIWLSMIYLNTEGNNRH